MSKADAQAYSQRVVRTVFRHVVPNVFGLGPAISREATASKKYPNTSPGWRGLSDEAATFAAGHGVTSPKREQFRTDERERKAGEKASAQEKRQLKREEGEPGALRSRRHAF
jgi:hypothetical protein